MGHTLVRLLEFRLRAKMRHVKAHRSGTVAVGVRHECDCRIRNKYIDWSTKLE